MPLDFEKYDQSSWLKLGDLSEGKRLIVTIYRVYEQRFQDGKESPVLEFDELDKKLSLNRTRLTRMRELLGDNSDEWIGHQLVLYSGYASYDGKMVPSICIDPAPKKKPRPAADDSDVVFGTR